MTSLILTACAQTRFDTKKSTGLIIPTVIPYDSDFLNKVADEAEGGSCPMHVELGKDYKLTRDRLRIAKKELSE